MSLPPRPSVRLDGSVAPGTRAALEAADRLIVGIVDGDVDAIARELALEVCAWWSGGRGLRSVHGPAAVARALARLLDDLRPERLTSRATPEGSVLVSAIDRDHLLWTIELRPERGRFVGCVVRSLELGRSSLGTAARAPG